MQRPTALTASAMAVPPTRGWCPPRCALEDLAVASETAPPRGPPVPASYYDHARAVYLVERLVYAHLEDARHRRGSPASRIPIIPCDRRPAQVHASFQHELLSMTMLPPDRPRHRLCRVSSPAYPHRSPLSQSSRPTPGIPHYLDDVCRLVNFNIARAEGKSRWSSVLIARAS